MGLQYTNTAATTAAVANRLVASANMKVGTYTLANGGVAVWSGGFLVTVTHTEVGGGVDTLGTITFTGTAMSGATITDVIVPVQDSAVTGVKIFKSVTSIVGAGWVIGTGNDTITCGVAAGNYAAGSGGILGGILVNNSVAAAIVISSAAGTIVTVPASQAAGTYYDLQGVEFPGYLKVATTSTNDVTVFHSGTVPAYATA